MKSSQTEMFAVDVGGTFTDFSLVYEDSGALFPYKVPSTRHAPARAVGEGLRALKALDFDVSAIEYFVHGATIAINTVLQRNGAAVALFVTGGFRDVLEIQRLRLLHPFDFNSTRPVPLVPRSHVFEIQERILTDGTVDIPLDVYVESPDDVGGFVRHHEIPRLVQLASPVYVKFGLRNAPDVYPSGTHLDDTTVRLSRERVRRARLGLDLLARSGVEAACSAPGSWSSVLGAASADRPVTGSVSPVWARSFERSCWSGGPGRRPSSRSRRCE